MKREIEKRVPDDVLAEIGGIGSLVLGAILTILYFQPDGVIGRLIVGVVGGLLGLGYFFVVSLCFLLGVALLRHFAFAGVRLLGLGVVSASLLGLGGLLFENEFGLIGRALAAVENVIGLYAGVVLYVGLFLAGIVMFALSPVFSQWAARAKGKLSAQQPKEQEIKIREPKQVSGESRKAKSETSKESGEKIPEKPEILFRPLVSRKWKLPPLSLLGVDGGRPESGDLNENARIIKKTFENFGIPVEMEEVIVGPTVTQYTLKPASGVKLTRITGLSNDLALALAAHPIRIEAPIPGKSLVGIEVPNRKGATVRLRTLLEEAPKHGYLSVPVGQSISGDRVFADIAKMPHLLVAGSTGSGKSVLVHAIILSLLYQHAPETLRFILIDPKRVELGFYSGLPHLLTDPILNPKKAVSVFKWVIQEMEQRYDLLQVHRARDLADFNATKMKDKKLDEILPYIVVVIDELADLMQVSSREVEAAITRISQMARAVGIHLVLATQRPSVDVLTGLIKANITYRVAMQVASQVDSRTILDTAGADKLLGKGDLLYLAPELSKPKRLQAPLVVTDEIRRVAKWWEEQGQADIEERINLAHFEESDDLGGDGAVDENDPMLDEALAVIKTARKASASLLQRRLKVGYARAARILDILEARGYIGPGEGAKPREVFIEKFDDIENE